MQPDHLVLAADDIAGLELRRERERGAALRAEPFGATGTAAARDRPTCSPHLEQKRFSSGTSGLAITTDWGSGTGADGTVVMPAPRCWIRAVARTSRRVGRLRPARAEPMGELDSLVESAGCFLPLGVPVGVDTAVARRRPRASRTRCSSRPRSGRCSPVACTPRCHDGSPSASIAVSTAASGSAPSRRRLRPALRAGTPPRAGARARGRTVPTTADRARLRTRPRAGHPRHGRCARPGSGTRRAARAGRRARPTARRRPVLLGRAPARTDRARRVLVELLACGSPARGVGRVGTAARRVVDR